MQPETHPGTDEQAILGHYPQVGLAALFYPKIMETRLHVRQRKKAEPCTCIYKLSISLHGVLPRAGKCVEVGEVNAETIILPRLPITHQHDPTSRFTAINPFYYSRCFQLSHFLLHPFPLFWR